MPFTGRTSNKTADVLHFSFSVIVDSRRIGDLLEAISRKNLYTILNVSLSREDVEINKREFLRFDRSESFNPRKDAAEDLVYGTDPIVRLNVDAELLFLRELYSKDTPEQIKATWGKKITQEQSGRPTVSKKKKSKRKPKGKSKRRPKKK